MIWTPLELAANLMTVLCIFLAGRNNIHTWWVGIVACVLFGVLFYQANLYADVTLQLFFIITGIMGWMSWSKLSKTFEGPEACGADVFENALPITVAKHTTVALMVCCALAVAGGYAWVLHTFTDAFAPAIDSLVLTLSVVAQLLLMRRNVQTWPMWVVVNILSVPLYISRELYLTAGLYTVFLFHALWAFKNWLDLMDAKANPPPPAIKKLAANV